LAASESASRYHAAVTDAPLFEARGLAIAARDRRLLGGLGLSVGKRSVIAIQGPSGLGKTTLLRTLAGLIDPAEGELRLAGQSPAELGYPRYRRQVVYVAQRPVLLAGSVLDNLRMPFAYATAAGAALDEDRCRERLGAMALRGVLDSDATTLSEGQKQRVAFVRALAIAPRVLLLDEPTSALDPVSCEGLERCLRDYLDDQDAAAVVVTHDADQIARLGAEVVDLSEFAEVADG
jgi:putative ABC transport system ATP-binding protein